MLIIDVKTLLLKINKNTEIQSIITNKNIK